MRYRGLKLVTPPVYEPLTLGEAESHLRLDDTDPELGGVITQARDIVEKYVKRALYAQTWRMTMDVFPYGKGAFSEVPSWANTASIDLPVSPVISITSIKYYDYDEVEQTLSASLYRLATSDTASITPAYGEAWPSTLDITGGITIDFVAGYTSAAEAGDPNGDIPPAIKTAIRLMLTQLYDNRSNVDIPMGVVRLLSGDKDIRY